MSGKEAEESDTREDEEIEGDGVSGGWVEEVTLGETEEKQPRQKGTCRKDAGR